MHKLIKLQEGYIIVSDEDIKPKDKVVLLRDNLLGKVNDIVTIISSRESKTKIIKANGKEHWFAAEVNYQRDWNYLKIIASNYIPELPNINFNNLKKEFDIVDVKKLANNQFDEDTKKIPVPTSYWIDSQNAQFNSFIKGFNKCLELNKDKLYTKVDVLKVIKMAREEDRVVLHSSDYSEYLYNNDEIIQSLQPKTDWNIEVEMNSCSEDIGICALGCIGNCKPKITNNQIKITNIL